jgi:hypothetical protein
VRVIELTEKWADRGFSTSVEFADDAVVMVDLLEARTGTGKAGNE